MAGIASLKVCSWNFQNKRRPPNISHEKIRKDIINAAKVGHVYDPKTGGGSVRKHRAKVFARTMGRRMKRGR